MYSDKEYWTMIESGDTEILRNIVRESNERWACNAIERIQDAEVLREFLTGKYAYNVACQIERITGKSVCSYLDRWGMVGKVLPLLQETKDGNYEWKKRVMLDEFHKRKFGYYFNDNGPRLDKYNLENQIYQKNLDEAYMNVSLHDVDVRLRNIICCGVDSSDEMSYISSQDNKDEFRAVLWEYLEWSIKKLCSMDLLKGEDK